MKMQHVTCGTLLHCAWREGDSTACLHERVPDGGLTPEDAMLALRSEGRVGPASAEKENVHLDDSAVQVEAGGKDSGSGSPGRLSGESEGRCGAG